MTEHEKKVYNIIGLAIKANKVIYGGYLLQAIRRKKVFLVFSAKTIGATQQKMFFQKCYFYNIAYQPGITEAIFTALFPTTNVKTIGITDRNLAAKIKEMIIN